jgi:hypothetical protein
LPDSNWANKLYCSRVYKTPPSELKRRRFIS